MAIEASGKLRSAGSVVPAGTGGGENVTAPASWANMVGLCCINRVRRKTTHTTKQAGGDHWQYSQPVHVCCINRLFI